MFGKCAKKVALSAGFEARRQLPRDGLEPFAGWGAIGLVCVSMRGQVFPRALEESERLMPGSPQRVRQVVVDGNKTGKHHSCALPRLPQRDTWVSRRGPRSGGSFLYGVKRMPGVSSCSPQERKRLAGHQGGNSAEHMVRKVVSGQGGLGWDLAGRLGLMGLEISTLGNMPSQSTRDVFLLVRIWVSLTSSI